MILSLLKMTVEDVFANVDRWIGKHLDNQDTLSNNEKHQQTEKKILTFAGFPIYFIGNEHIFPLVSITEVSPGRTDPEKLLNDAIIM